MKKLFFLLIILTLISCEIPQEPKRNTVTITGITDPAEQEPEATPETNEPEPVVEPEPQTDPEPVEPDPVTEPEPIEPEPDPPLYFQSTENQSEFAYFDGVNTYVYDGIASTPWCTGKTTPAGLRMFANTTTLYTLDYHANITNSKNIIAVHDFSVVTGDGVYWGADRVAPADAYAAGAMYKDYVRIFRNGVEYGDWKTRQYYLSDFVNYNNDVYTIKSNGTYEHVNGTNIVKVISDGLIITDFSSTGKFAYFNGTFVQWTLNYMNNANYWLYCESENKYVSQNGYIWGSAGIQENSNQMAEFRLSPYPIDGLSGAPIVISVGTRNVNGDDLTYWIECNTGWLFSYNVRLDLIQLVKRLYVGDGSRETGVAYQAVLKPVISSSGKNIAFGLTDGYIYEYNFDTNLVRQLFVKPVWIKEM